MQYYIAKFLEMFMKISKPIQLIAFLFAGVSVLSLLAYLTTLVIFPNTFSLIGNSVSKDEVVTSDGSQGAPDYRESVEPGVISKDLIYPPTPGYGSGGDGSKLIKTAQLSITVSDFDKTVNQIKSKVSEVKGFVANLSDSGTLNDRVISITLRVPQNKFDEVLTSIKGLASEVKSINEGADDISEVYQDTQARLKTQKAYETQLLKLLDKATKVSDIISIQQQLSSVREQIEMYELQLKNYDSQVDMSTVVLTIQKAPEALDVAGDGWKLMGVVKEALTSLVAFGKGVLTLSVWLIVFSPVVLIPYAIYKLVKTYRKRKNMN